MAVTTFGGFEVKSDGDDITLKWFTILEDNLQVIEIYRKPASGGNFSLIASITPKGNNSSYTYIDNSAFKTSGHEYFYKLKFVSANSIESTESYAMRVDHSNVSGVKRTWGSIKAMFR